MLSSRYVCLTRWDADSSGGGRTRTYTAGVADALAGRCITILPLLQGGTPPRAWYDVNARHVVLCFAFYAFRPSRKDIRIHLHFFVLIKSTISVVFLGKIVPIDSQSVITSRAGDEYCVSV